MVTEAKPSLKLISSIERLSREEGLEKGLLAKGVAVAEKMLARGVSIDDIAEFTEMSVAEIEALRDHEGPAS